MRCVDAILHTATTVLKTQIFDVAIQCGKYLRLKRLEGLHDSGATKNALAKFK